MGGFFGTISTTGCVADLFYGTDYNSHLGTRRGGLATFSHERGFFRSIHNLENSYFRTKFEGELGKFQGNSGIGVISDTDAQPLLMNSHLGRFALVTVAKINNIEALAEKLLAPYFCARCSKSFLVNLRHARGVRGKEVAVGGDLLPVTRTRHDAFWEQFRRYIGGLS